MFTKDFYNVIDRELDELLEKYHADQFIQKHRNAVNNQKSYALLIWFLEFYGKISNYTHFITEGENDRSCDIVFDKKNNYGDKIFYVVQSKWNNAVNSEKESEKDEILKALSDFTTILRNGKDNFNDKLRLKLEELNQHLKENGEVKFIFLTLSQYRGGADENIKAFINNDEKVKFEVIDINRIKLDYIDRKYKKIDPLNPLESYQNPEESLINIEIVQGNGSIKIEKPFEAYLFLMRPKSIYNLFEQYGFALFHKNVRNPLLQSEFNAEIEKTALENPAYFWYYNNGITAITYLLPKIGKKAEKLELTGLQVINGAQTVYAIYRAYKTASPTKRIQMDSESLLTLRLLKSGGTDFDLNVTRYTNSQNPIYDRDFCANDDIQIRLQNDSYQTQFWYEKRRDEFRELPQGIEKVPNSVFANVYLAYHLQDPVRVLSNYRQQRETRKDLIFISHREHQEGLYEKIFNSTTSFEDMRCAFYLFDVLVDVMGSTTPYTNEDTFKTPLYHILALFKIVFTKYLQAKFDQPVNVNKHIIRIYERGEKEVILKTFRFINQVVMTKLVGENHPENVVEAIMPFLVNRSSYEKIKDALQDLNLSVEDIENQTV